MKSSLKISEKLHSAFLLSTALAAGYPRHEWLTLNQVADQFRLSQGYLEEVVAALRLAKLVTGRRGASGGYRLSKDPNAITFADIVVAIEGPTALVNCEACFLQSDCSNETMWQELQSVVIDFFRNKTLASEAQKAKYQKFADPIKPKTTASNATPAASTPRQGVKITTPTN